MTPNEEMDLIAKRMVSLLFDDTLTLKFDRVLYPCCQGTDLVAAVYQFCEQNSIDPPKGVALTRDSATERSLREKYVDRGLSVTKVDILEEDIDLDRQFDYVLGVPPAVDWTELNDERRREYAASLSRVSPDDSAVDSDGLYIERSLQFLRPDGRGVFLTAADLTTDSTATSAREYLTPLVNDITEVPSEESAAFDEPHMITIVTGEGDGEFEPDDRVNRPDPGEIELQLAAAAHESHERWTAKSIMTPANKLLVVNADRDASSVYFQLFYKDYDTTLVYDKPDNRSGLHGAVSRVTLTVEGTETIAEHAEPIPTERCLDPAVGLEALLAKLGQYRFCFVGESTDPDGLITRYDLNKLPVYHQLYDQLARFEIGLRQLIREHAPNWEERTTVTLGAFGSRELVPDRLTMAKLRDLIRILQDLSLESELGVDLSKHSASLHDIATLRNAVAHYNSLVHVMSSRPTDDDPERGAPQLATEYHLLSACLKSLEQPSQ